MFLLSIYGIIYLGLLSGAGSVPLTLKLKQESRKLSSVEILAMFHSLPKNMPQVEIQGKVSRR